MRDPEPGFAERVKDSFARQGIMGLFGAMLEAVEPGKVRIALPFHEELSQQHGFVHAGVIATIADSACGYAAYTLMPAGAAVLTIEYKINLLAPAAGDRFVAEGTVIRGGRTITTCRADVTAEDGDRVTPVATMLATLMSIEGRADVPSG